MRAFDARTTSDREAEFMRGLIALQRAARREPDRLDEMFERACALVPAMPLKVQIQTTTRCNAACAMCPYPVVTEEPGFEHASMSEERYRRILDDLAGGGVERLSLFLMNEPLLDRRLARWIELARAALPGCALGLFSNGAALDAGRARDLARAGLDELCISVHGFEPNTYERVMGGLSFARLRRNLDQVLDAAEAGELGAMHLQIVTGDVPEVAATAQLAPLRYRGRIVLKAFSNERTAIGAELTPKVASVEPQRAPGLGPRASALSRSISTGDPADFVGTPSDPGSAWSVRHERTPGLPLPSSVGGIAGDAPCQRPFVKLYVLTTGECVMCNVDWRRTVLLGRVGDAGGPSVSEVWRGEPYRRIRREHFTGRFERAALCSRCDYAQVVDSE